MRTKTTTMRTMTTPTRMRTTSTKNGISIDRRRPR
jgi:hypothetical protein